MPQLGNISVKDYDGVTDRIYYGLVASGGDKSPALWQNPDYGSASAFRPQLTVVSRPNGTGTGRRMDFAFTFPEVFVNTFDGSSRVVNKYVANASILVPQSMKIETVNAAGAQFGHLMGSALAVQMLTSGYSAT